ncbi:hypothetical protein L6R29_06165 [Myxococcota bacterium]|nr:hypothetical protein [Myxococcota bacterium]
MASSLFHTAPKRTFFFLAWLAVAAFAVLDCTPPGVDPNQEKISETQSNKENGTVETSTESSTEATTETSTESSTEATTETTTETTTDGSIVENAPDKPLPDETPDTPKEQGPLSCKNDCDCYKAGQACVNNQCADVDRVNQCPPCEDPQRCLVGQPCVDKTGNIGTCPAVACQDDCDCFALGLVCHEKACAPLKRANLCPSCENTPCPAGASCYTAKGTLAKCPGTGVGTACKHDCDCLKFGLLCDGTNGCRALRRLSQCKSCGDATCVSGEPCFQHDQSLSTCPADCKHDCDCVKYSQVCDSNNKCASLRRMSLCLSCTDVLCKTGDPCRNQDGTLGSCCCNVSGCPQGQLCCSGGAPPPPGICGRFCTAPDPQTKHCPAFP